MAIGLNFMLNGQIISDHRPQITKHQLPIADF